MVFHDAACGAKCVERLSSADMLHSQPHYLNIAIVDHQRMGRPSLTHGATRVDRIARPGPERLRTGPVRRFGGSRPEHCWRHDGPMAGPIGPRQDGGVSLTPPSAAGHLCMTRAVECGVRSIARPAGNRLVQGDAGPGGCEVCRSHGRKRGRGGISAASARAGGQKEGPHRSCAASSTIRLAQGENVR